MSTEDQIALFEQRAFKGKLHLPTASGSPLCGRQLNNHRAQKSQQSDKITFAQSPDEFAYQLMSGKACRHCGYASGMLIKTIEKFENEEPSDDL